VCESAACATGSSIAHEVNQPLAGIVTNAGTCLRMLAADPPDVAGAGETARRTIRDGNRAAEVIGRLRALFAKEGADMSELDLNEAVREVVALSSGDLQRHWTMVQMEFDHDLPVVIADRIQLQQVALNLLLNAADAMKTVEDRPRRVVIRTGLENEHVTLSVQDVGVGIQPEITEKIFDAFYTTKTGGMGVGLSVSRSIIERHQGRIWAASNDGPGVTFHVTIARTPTESRSRTEITKLMSTQDGR
jgi:C4-dicarboxylate-specific signal transduction histidine kinase